MSTRVTQPELSRAAIVRWLQSLPPETVVDRPTGYSSPCKACLVATYLQQWYPDVWVGPDGWRPNKSLMSLHVAHTPEIEALIYKIDMYRIAGTKGTAGEILEILGE